MISTADAPSTSPTLQSAPAGPPPSGRARARTHHTVSHKLTAAVSLSAPSVRTMVIVVSVSEGLPWSESVPVVSLEARIIREYSASVPVGQSAPTAPDHAGMIRAGWTYEGERVERDAIVIDDEMGLMAAEELYGDVCNLAYRIVATPWDPAEDDDRLKPAIASVQAEAIRRESDWRRKSGE